MYIYPDNLRAKATFWLWQLKDIGIISVCGLVSILALTQTDFWPPVVLTGVYAVLTILSVRPAGRWRTDRRFRAPDGWGSGAPEKKGGGRAENAKSAPYEKSRRRAVCGALKNTEPELRAGCA